jgi:CBS domain-containing protein
MHASDLQVSLPVVTRATTGRDAARLIVRDRLAGLVVTDDDGAPIAVVSSADVLGLLVPGYLLEDVALAGVLDEAGADEVWAGAARRTIGELLADDDVVVRDILHVTADATLVELAVLMVDAHTQVAIVDPPAEDPRFVTLPAVMDAILAAADGAGAVG